MLTMMAQSFHDLQKYLFCGAKEKEYIWAWLCLFRNVFLKSFVNDFWNCVMICEIMLISCK